MASIFLYNSCHIDTIPYFNCSFLIVHFQFIMNDGIRFYKTVNGIRTDFLIDSNQIYPVVLQERDELGNSIAHYTYGKDILSQFRNATYYYAQDATYSNRFLFNNISEYENKYEYSAFGQRISKIEHVRNPIQFASEWFDEELKLSYMRQRYYHPKIARFISQDIGIYVFRNPQTFNLFTYALNNPIVNRDPSGRFNVSALVSGAIRGILTIGAIAYIGGPAVQTFFGKEKDEIKRGLIRNFAIQMVNAFRDRNDCEGMARIYEYAGSLYGGMNDDEYRFVNDVQVILTEFDGPWALLTRNGNSKDYSVKYFKFRYTWAFFMDKGFSDEFRDNPNQVRHFTGFFAEGYFWGPALTLLSVYLNEFPGRGLLGMNPFDAEILPGKVAANFGYSLRMGLFGYSLRNIGNMIRFAVCRQ